MAHSMQRCYSISLKEGCCVTYNHCCLPLCILLLKSQIGCPADAGFFVAKTPWVQECEYWWNAIEKGETSKVEKMKNWKWKSKNLGERSVQGANISGGGGVGVFCTIVQNTLYIYKCHIIHIMLHFIVNTWFSGVFKFAFFVWFDLVKRYDKTTPKY